MAGDDRRDFLKKVVTSVGGITLGANGPLQGQGLASEAPQEAVPAGRRAAPNPPVGWGEPPRLPRAESGAPLVNITHEGNEWIIRGQRNVVTLNQTTLEI